MPPPVSISVPGLESPRSPVFPAEVLQRILKHVYHITVATPFAEHYCSRNYPCAVAQEAVRCFKDLARVSKAWDRSVLNVQPLFRPIFRMLGRGSFCGLPMKRIILAGRFRPYQLIENNFPVRVVLFAYDFSGPKGCDDVQDVVVKAWYQTDDGFEAESTCYRLLVVAPMDDSESDDNSDGGTDPEDSDDEDEDEDKSDNVDNENGDQKLSPMCAVPSLLYVKESDEELKTVLAFEKLGPSLKNVQEKIPRFNEKMTLAIAIQLLDRYKALHARGIIHNKCEPSSFCLPQKPHSSNLSISSANNQMIHIIDFESSKHEFHLYQLSENRNQLWNPCFSSALSQIGLTLSQRDDLESLGYLLVHLYKGKLPWTDSNSKWRMKLSTRTVDLFEGMDPSFAAFFNEVRRLAFQERPPYETMNERFCEVWRIRGYGGVPGKLDWWSLIDSEKPPAVEVLGCYNATTSLAPSDPVNLA